jgi:hypothetical protein
MKKICKVILAAAAVVALAAPAMATDKLIIKDPAGTTTVFKVDDTGVAAGKKIGFNVLNPEVTVHSAETQTGARGFLTAQHNDGAHAAFMLFRKSRGTNTNLVPNTFDNAAKVIQGDFPGSLDAQAWDGYNYLGSAGAAFTVDGTPVQGAVSTGYPSGLNDVNYPGRIPMAYVVYTGTKGGSLATNGRGERFRIASDGRLRLSNQPAAPVSGTTACTAGDMILDAPNGFLYLCTVTGNTWKKATFN